MPAPFRTRRTLTWALASWALVLTPAPAQTASPQIGAFGRVRPGERIVAVAVPNYNGATQIVAELSVRSGDHVLAGQRLAVTQSQVVAKAEVVIAQARVATVTQRLQSLQAGARAEEVSAQEEQIKSLEAEVRALRARKAPSATEAKNEAAAHEAAANAKVAMSRHQLAALRTPRPADVAVAQAELAEAQAGLDRATALLATTEVHAPGPGQILKIVTAPGESSAGRPLLEMGDTAAMTVQAEVPASDVAKVQVGATAIIKSDTLVGELRGKVSRVGLTVDRSSLTALSPFANVDRHIVEVTITPETPEQLRGKTGVLVTVLITAAPSAR